MTGAIIQFACAAIQAVCFYLNMKHKNYGMAVFCGTFFCFALVAGIIRAINL